MYALLIDPDDHLNGRVLSRHRKLDAMRSAANRYLSMVARHNGPGSYVRLVPAVADRDGFLPLSSGESDEYYYPDDYG